MAWPDRPSFLPTAIPPKTGSGVRRLPWPHSSDQVDDAVGEALVAEDDAELAAGDDPLEDLELAQTHERGVIDQDLRRVRLAPQRGGLLAPGDEVGLGGLLRLRDLVHQLSHL